MGYYIFEQVEGGKELPDSQTWLIVIENRDVPTFFIRWKFLLYIDKDRRGHNKMKYNT